jgi:bifunctional N-acetylglutamate synthase/kinase
MPSSKSVQATVMRSLMAVGSKREAKFYAGIFQDLAPERFALIVIDPRCLVSPLLEALISDLKILSNLGLTPVLVVGALHADKTNVRMQSQRLCQALDRAKIKMAKLNCASYQFISDVRRQAKSGRFVVLEMTEYKTGFDLQSLADRLQPAKIVFLQPSGGFQVNGKRLAVVNVDSPDSFPTKDQLSKGQLKFIQMVKSLIGNSDYKCTYVIVSPLNLLSELFTVRGAGTMLRRGARVKCLKSYRGISKPTLKKSIETAFGRKLVPDFLKRPISKIILEENFRGGAIVTTLEGVPYLSKFWVTQEAQGEGIAHDIWQALRKDTPIFYWRSKNNNLFNNWYMKMCEGMQVSGDWRVFWIGLHASEIPAAVLAAANSPQDFK